MKYKILARRNRQIRKHTYLVLGYNGNRWYECGSGLILSANADTISEGMFRAPYDVYHDMKYKACSLWRLYGC